MSDSSPRPLPCPDAHRPNRPDDGHESPAVISLQPRPVSYTSVREHHPNGTWSTSIARLFRPEDVPHCRLCDRCIANPNTGLCLLVVPARVASGDAALYSLVGQKVSVQKN